MRCPSCGIENPEGLKFCGQCAAPLTEQPSASQPVAPLSYTPSHLTEKILHSRIALEGERKQVTALFADVSGFTAISEQLDADGERTYFTRLALGPLSEHESLRLAEGLLATSECPAELPGLIIRKAEGSPFFVEEVLKSLLEVGALTQQDGRDRLTKPLAELDVPETIQDMIMARIDRLAGSPKRAPQLAEVVEVTWPRRRRKKQL